MHSVVIHKYFKNLSAIEFGEESIKPVNFVVFVGGLGDGFLTVPYVSRLAETIYGQYDKKWVLVQALISSSYLGFGTGSLKRDCLELSELVKYLRSERGTVNSKVILMGHSTGSQDTMEYMSKLVHTPNFDSLKGIDAGIIQAPVSDCEGLEQFYGKDKTFVESLDKAQRFISEGTPNELMPADSLKYTFGSAATAYRFNSLLNQRGDDDYFSSYLQPSDHEKSFGKVSKPLLVLYSGNDEFAPKGLDKSRLIKSWEAACNPNYWSKYSKVLEGATHNVGENSKPGAVEDLIDSVLSFIGSEFESR